MADDPILERLPPVVQDERNRESIAVEFDSTQDVYTLPKAPVLTVYSVTDEDGTEYVEGTDYTLIQNSDGQPEKIDWSVGGDEPDGGANFVVDSRFETIINRYALAHDDEFHLYDADIDAAINSHYVDNASGEDLDRIGAIFGPLGRRGVRTDDDYRQYLKSIVKSFNGRGTVRGLRFAVAAAFGTAEDNIDIIEDFENLEYDIVVENWPAHSGSSIENLADLADPSVVTLGAIKYQFEEQAGVSDNVDVTASEIIQEAIAADDAATVDPNLFTLLEDVSIADDATVDGETTTRTEDVSIADVATVDDETTDTADESSVDDATASTEVDKNQFRWEDNGSNPDTNWDFFEWTEIIDLGTTTVTEATSVDDSGVLQPKAAVIAEDTATDDVGEVQPKAAVIAEDATVDDVGAVQQATEVSEGPAVDDTAATTVTQVAWETGDWETMHWAVEHN